MGFYIQDLISIVKYFLLVNPVYQDINLSYKNKYKLSEIAKKITNETNSKSDIIIQKEHGLNYNGNFDKLLSLPIKLEGFEKPIIKASKLNGIEYSSLIFELGNRKLVAGQEDLITQIAQTINKNE